MLKLINIFLKKICRGGYFIHQVLSAKKQKNKDGILIEFTFSIPVCIILLFFVSDYYRFYELKNKIKSSAYLMASMLQQLGNTKTDKQITINDLGRISYASCLNLFHTHSMFKDWPMGIYYCVAYYYVKRIGADNYTYQYLWISTGNKAEIKSDFKDYINMTYRAEQTKKTQSYVEAIHSDLVCQNNGDERVLIRCYYNISTSTNFTKSKLGLYILEPKFGEKGNFKYDLVIVPKPGLFPVKNG